MSYGALSWHAILALNGGAKKGSFYHNTGEGSISPFHLKMGGDIVWQIGTGYFGCRTEDGFFDRDKFKEKAQLPTVKMIEIKLSQGAKPGHGGILPGIKNTDEIAKIRGVKPHTTVYSPPYHSAFSSVEGLLDFVVELREMTGGKPIGFKLCVGDKREMEEICQAMVRTGKMPDFITVDGAEGGTGAAPLEFSNHIGMPGQEAIAFVTDMLRGYDLKKDIKLIYSGKVISAFDIVRALAAGADLCNSARAMMFALGCIQSLRCNDNSCPTGVATQDRHLEKGLNVDYKKERVANFHKETVIAAVEIFAATGVDKIENIGRDNLYQWSGGE
jgi:glutamate synthase domain-containing protein 2